LKVKFCPTRLRGQDLGGNRLRGLLKTLLGRVDKTPTGQYFYLKEEIREELGAAGAAGAALAPAFVSTMDIVGGDGGGGGGEVGVENA
jgi:hypothetical protein